MKLLSLLFVLLFLVPKLSHAEPSADEACLDQVVFSLDFSFEKRSEAKLTKNQNKLKFIVFSGKGERKEVDLSRGDISIDAYPAIDATKPHTLHAGSANCPKPLFGVDFAIAPGEAEAYRQARERLYNAFTAAEKTYSKGDTNSQLQCTKKLLRSYLDDCLALEAPKGPPKPEAL